MATNTRTAQLVAIDAGLHKNAMTVIDVLSEKGFYRDAHWVEANDYTTHHYLQTLTEPHGSNTVYNVGVAWELGTDAPVTEVIQGLMSYSKMDVKILEDHPNPAKLRQDYDKKAMRGMAKGVDSRVLYGNSTVGNYSSVSSAEILGLHSRFGKISGATYNQRAGSNYWNVNVVSAAGSTSNVQASAWTIKWADDGLFMINPRGGKGFVDVHPLPEPQVIVDSNGYAVEWEITRYSISFGLGVGDWRNVQRICNINKATDSKPWTSALQVQVEAWMPDGEEGAIIYVNRTVWQQILNEAMSNSNVFHFDEAPWGGVTKVPYFGAAAISPVDELVSTEPVIS